MSPLRQSYLSLEALYMEVPHISLIRLTDDVKPPQQGYEPFIVHPSNGWIMRYTLYISPALEQKARQLWPDATVEGL